MFSSATENEFREPGHVIDLVGILHLLDRFRNPGLFSNTLFQVNGTFTNCWLGFGSDVNPMNSSKKPMCFDASTPTGPLDTSWLSPVSHNWTIVPYCPDPTEFYKPLIQIFYKYYRSCSFIFQAPTSMYHEFPHIFPWFFLALQRPGYAPMLASNWRPNGSSAGTPNHLAVMTLKQQTKYYQYHTYYIIISILVVLYI